MDGHPGSRKICLPSSVTIFDDLEALDFSMCFLGYCFVFVLSFQVHWLFVLD